MSAKKEFKELLEYLRKTGKKQVDLVPLLGCHESFISRMIAGRVKPSFKILNRMVSHKIIKQKNVMKIIGRYK